MQLITENTTDIEHVANAIYLLDSFFSFQKQRVSNNILSIEKDVDTGYILKVSGQVNETVIYEGDYRYIERYITMDTKTFKYLKNIYSNNIEYRIEGPFEFCFKISEQLNIREIFSLLEPLECISVVYNKELKNMIIS